MTAARARRRHMRHERYRHRALLLGARPSLGGASHAHAAAFWQAMHVGRWAPIGIRREPWTLPDPNRFHGFTARTAYLDEPACRVCGCTQDRACEGGCWWWVDAGGTADERGPLCSSCEDPE